MLSIVVPTYNESKNIEELITSVFSTLNKAGIAGELIIVDDGSPDGTDQLVVKMAQRYPVRLIQRDAKKGLASAVMEGFSAAKYEIVCAMDADLSHPVEVLPALYEKVANNFDISVGSRLVPGGSSEDWTLHRKFISAFARSLAVPLTTVKDLTSGYFMLKRSVIEGVRLNPIGFKILLEILVKGRYQKAAEVPIVFKDRKGGKSKMGLKQQWEYLQQLVDLYHVKYPVPSEFVRFGLVGGTGVVINILVLALFKELFHVHYLIAAVPAFIVAASSNFYLNKVITFPGKNGLKIQHQYINFFLASLAGVLLNVGILYLLVEFGHWWLYYAQLTAILLVGVINFINAKVFAFR